MPHEAIATVLREFAGCSRAFSLHEAGDLAPAAVSLPSLASALGSCEHFIVLGPDSDGTPLFVATEAMFRWYAQFNISLAKASLSWLSARAVAKCMSMFRLSGKWDTPPDGALEYGCRFGLIRLGCCELQQYVFPLAAVLRYLTQTQLGIARSFLLQLGEQDNRAELIKPTLESRLLACLRMCDKRTARVMTARSGMLGSQKATLEQLGAELGLTRERVRQIEAGFRESLGFSGQCASPVVTGFLCEMVRRQGSLVLMRPAALLRSAARWLNIPIGRIALGGSTVRVLGLAHDMLSLPISAFRSQPGTVEVGAIGEHLQQTGGLTLPVTDCDFLARRLNEQRMTKARRVYLVLKAMGKPAHYSAIAESYGRMFPDEHCSEHTEHNIHAILSREELGIVWVGIRGTFALAEWGYEHPSVGLFETVSGIVRDLHGRTGRPVPLSSIAAEMGKHRRLVKPGSLFFAAHCNPTLRRVSRDAFLPAAGTDQAEGEGEISPDALDRALGDFTAEQ